MSAGLTVAPRAGHGESSLKLNPNQIDYLAFRLLKHLEKAEAVAARDFDQAHRALIDIISDDFAVEDALNVDVRKILEAFEGQMQKEGVQYHEMFKKVKAKLIKERGLIL
jgi:hypothetical protein